MPQRERLILPPQPPPVRRGRPRKPLAPPNPNALVFRIPEVRLLGGPAPRTVYSMIAAGRLKAVRVGGLTLVDGDSLRELLKNGPPSSTSA